MKPRIWNELIEIVWCYLDSWCFVFECLCWRDVVLMSEIVVVVLEADFVYSECAAGRLYRNPADLNWWIILLIPELKSSLKTYSGGSKILFGLRGFHVTFLVAERWDLANFLDSRKVLISYHQINCELGKLQGRRKWETEKKKKQKKRKMKK